jgi:hypothetical protein
MSSINRVFRRPARLFAGVLRDRNGAVAVLLAIALSAIVGFAGLGSEVAAWYPSLAQPVEGGHRQDLTTVKGVEKESAPATNASAAVARSDHGFQPFPVAQTKPDLDAFPHPARLAYTRASWNHSSAPLQLQRRASSPPDLAITRLRC